MKSPLDPYSYPQDARSKQAAAGLSDGLYAYVQDERGIEYVLPDGPHIHPKVLGMGRSAIYAGDFTLAQGVILEVTNLSGTFQFDDPDGLLAAASQLELQGLTVATGAVRYFPADGSPPRVLR